MQKDIGQFNWIYDKLNEDIIGLIEPMLKNAAFMEKALSELREDINNRGCMVQYICEKGKYGTTVNGSLKEYNKMYKEYRRTLINIMDLIPDDHKERDELIDYLESK